MRISDWSSDVCSSDLAPGPWFADVNGTGRKIKKQDAWRDIVMLTEQITDVAPQVQTGPGYVVPVQSYVRCSISGQIFAILAAETDRHVDIDVKHDLSYIGRASRRA